MTHLTIITPCTRPRNLPAIWESIKPLTKVINLTWFIVFDGDITLPTELLNNPYIIHTRYDGGIYGNAQRNHALHHILDGWVMFLDDDNIVHPDFAEAFAKYCSDWLGLILPQELPDGTIRQPNVIINGIDTAQFVLHTSIIDTEWQQAQNADGRFICDIYSRHKDSILLISGWPLCYYNKLRRLELI